ncbi:MAG: quinolinate synthase NadA [Proteobacteria bacterium]|nr:quinolinate synthase NadA [Pseudomonadota bacterium]MBU1687505.1 quinolinate synthase NadA [Pseudomonadota bacterium]
MCALQQVDLDPVYLEDDEQSLTQKIAQRRKELGDDLLILGHHYQQEAVFQFADLVGDSLKLARAASQQASRYIVFCGVHFMAETADILTADHQTVILPDLRAGCPMADMAAIDQVEYAWQDFTEAVPGARLIPITYVNSAARIKAFVGRRGGAVCTSSNAERVLTWALDQGDKVIFLPDEHLGRNSAHAMGMSGDDVVLWDRDEVLGGNTPETLARARVILWNGYCTVHMQFTASQVARWREQDPAIRVIVHPECRREVVAAADHYGSTEAIIKTIADSPAGTTWAVGTEINLVNRLAHMFPAKKVHSLSPFQCLCSTMYRIKPGYLLWVLDNLVEGRIVNRITVPPEVAEGARLSLNRMLEI